MQVKQKTLDTGETLILKRKKSPVKGERYVYEIHNGKVEIIDENAGTTKEEALDEFEHTVDLYQHQNENQDVTSGISFF